MPGPPMLDDAAIERIARGDALQPPILPGWVQLVAPLGGSTNDDATGMRRAVDPTGRCASQ